MVIRDLAPEYDFKDAVPSPYADRYRADYVPLVTGTIEMQLEYDEAVDAAYLTISDAPWDCQVRLHDARGINYAADGSVIGIEILSLRRNGVVLDGIPHPDDVTRVLRSVGFRIVDRPVKAAVGS